MQLPKKEKVLKCNLNRRKNHLYFIDKNGNVGEVRMKRGRAFQKEIHPPKVVLKSNIKKEKGYLYFLDEDGDIGRVKATRGAVNSKDRIKLKNRKIMMLKEARSRNKREKRYID